MKLIDIQNTIDDAYFAGKCINHLIYELNKQAGLITTLKQMHDEDVVRIEELEKFQKEVEKTYPFMCKHSTVTMLNEVTNEEKVTCKKCGKDLTPRTDGEKLIKWFREYNGV